MDRRQVVVEDGLLDEIRLLTVDRVDAEERKEALVFVALASPLRRSDLSAHDVPGAQAESTDLRRGDVDVFLALEVVVIRGPQEAEVVRQDLEDTLAFEQLTTLGLSFEYSRDQVLLAQAAVPHYAEVARDLAQILYGLLL